MFHKATDDPVDTRPAADVGAKSGMVVSLPKQLCHQRWVAPVAMMDGFDKFCHPHQPTQLLGSWVLQQLIYKDKWQKCSLWRSWSQTCSSLLLCVVCFFVYNDMTWTSYVQSCFLTCVILSLQPQLRSSLCLCFCPPASSKIILPTILNQNIRKQFGKHFTKSPTSLFLKHYQIYNLTSFTLLS